MDCPYHQVVKITAPFCTPLGEFRDVFSLAVSQHKINLEDCRCHISSTLEIIFRIVHYADKKENKIFLLYKKVQKGAVAKSYMTNGLLICN